MVCVLDAYNVCIGIECFNHLLLIVEAFRIHRESCCLGSRVRVSIRLQ